MRRTHPLPASLLLSLTLLIASPGHGLERTTVPTYGSDHDAGWDAASSCALMYANLCTGWLWIWTGWDPEETFGVVFEPCCEGAQLVSTQVYFWTGAPPGWGYTGTIAVSDGSGNCVGTRYDGFSCLPSAGAVPRTWEDIPPGPIALTFTNGPSGEHGGHQGGGSVSIATDRGAAGPTGPQSCGLCYPTTRVTHTFNFGTPENVLCPGSPLSDPICDVEALGWSALFTCPVSVEPSSWGAIKNLYRD